MYFEFRLRKKFPENFDMGQIEPLQMREEKNIPLKKYILKNFAIFPGKNLCWSQCFHIFQLFSVSCNIWCQNLKSTELTPWTQDVLKQSEDVQDVF